MFGHLVEEIRLEATAKQRYTRKLRRQRPNSGVRQARKQRRQEKFHDKSGATYGAGSDEMDYASQTDKSYTKAEFKRAQRYSGPSPYNKRRDDPRPGKRYVTFKHKKASKWLTPQAQPQPGPDKGKLPR